MIFKKIVGIVIFVSIYVILTLLKLNIYIQIPILYLILIFTYNEKTQRVLIVIIWTLFNSILQIILKNINLYLLYIPLFEYIIIDIIFDKARRIYDKYKKYIISIIIILFISYVAFFVIPDFTKGFQQGWTEKMIKMDKEKLNHKQK